MDPDHGGSPHVLGIVDAADGVTYTSTETDSRSNALINWYLADPADRVSFRTSGSVSFRFRADRATHVSGEIFGDNYGFDQFRHGQTSIGVYAGRVAGDPGDEDDQVQISWKTGDGSAWYTHDPVTLEYDRWYHIGLAWGGPDFSHEIWVCGERGAGDSAGPLPWGVTWGTGSATNVGLGDNHERGYSGYGSAAGVTFADIRIWDEYRAQGDTAPCIVAQPPSTGVFEPTSLFGRVGQTAVFTTTVTDPNGYEDIAWSFLFLDRSPPVASGGLALAYYQPADLLFLLGGGACRPGQARTLSTDYVSLDCSQVRVSGFDQMLTYLWQVRPEQCFEGGCGWNYAYQYVTDGAGLHDEGLVGAWMLSPALPGARGARPVVTPPEADLQRMRQAIEAFQARAEALR
jgi:hypothetical protein